VIDGQTQLGQSANFTLTLNRNAYLTVLLLGNGDAQQQKSWKEKGNPLFHIDTNGYFAMISFFVSENSPAASP
jgi:hypothetical protein